MSGRMRRIGALKFAPQGGVVARAPINLAAALRGPAGVEGATGGDGADGADGSPGADGADGTPGTDARV
jgi:hypothetical protein